MYRSFEEEDNRNQGRAPRQDETISPSGPTAGSSSPERSTVDRLVKKLSKHNLQLDTQSRGPSQPPAPWPRIEVDTQFSSMVLPPTLDAGEPIEVDDEEDFDIKKLNFRRTVRRQPSGLGARQRVGGSSSSRSVESRLEKMIANETQCKVRREPFSATTPSSSTPSYSQSITMLPDLNSIEVDPDYAMPKWDGTLEVDPNYLNGNCDPDEEEATLLEESRLALRDAAGPSGIRKHSTTGPPLKYRLSVDAALRCQNVVRSRPRMRKREKSRFTSAASSAVGSAASSPVMAPQYYPPS
ncbi:hypothetical protein QBC38DRAFT_285594 [Podospora fimiseda]|uniref:Uncharacterized protein n=1 Tax=Podospora fimiseda TaxID=252190 RepID=A0AAN7GY31_9PEZI|nr:hypothetical protein QBC38DRAFT_285594 [Podospora fimiseda]